MEVCGLTPSAQAQHPVEVCDLTPAPRHSTLGKSAQPTLKDLQHLLCWILFGEMSLHACVLYEI